MYPVYHSDLKLWLFLKLSKYDWFETYEMKIWLHWIRKCIGRSAGTIESSANVGLWTAISPDEVHRIHFLKCKRKGHATMICVCFMDGSGRSGHLQTVNELIHDGNWGEVSKVEIQSHWIIVTWDFWWVQEKLLGQRFSAPQPILGLAVVAVEFNSNVPAGRGRLLWADLLWTTQISVSWTINDQDRFNP